MDAFARKKAVVIPLGLGIFESEAERDALAAKITKVIFINNDTGDYYEKTKAPIAISLGVHPSL